MDMRRLRPNGEISKNQTYKYNIEGKGGVLRDLSSTVNFKE